MLAMIGARESRVPSPAHLLVSPSLNNLRLLSLEMRPKLTIWPFMFFNQYVKIHSLRSLMTVCHVQSLATVFGGPHWLNTRMQVLDSSATFTFSGGKLRPFVCAVSD